MQGVLENDSGSITLTVPLGFDTIAAGRPLFATFDATFAAC